MADMRCTRRAITTGAVFLLAWLILSGCQVTSSFTPPTLKPIVATPTPATVSLPIVIHAEPEESQTPMVEKTSPPTPVPIFIPTEIPTEQLLETPAPEVPYITLLFTGVIVPARCVQSAIDARGDANYVYDEVRESISSADLAVGTLNTTLSDLSTHTGCIETYVLVSDSRSAVAAASAGIDVMSVATNHIKNCAGASCGDNYNRAFFDTLDNLRANNILPVGAGMNMDEALQPVVVEVQGIRFGFISLGMGEPMAFAGQDSPGIAELTDENLRDAIEAARQVSDVVIAMPHWGPEDSSDPNSYQLHFAQVAVEAGVDVVVGNHTHVVQAIQQIDGIDVFYGLGNFIFDQTWDLAHQQGVMLQLHFFGTDYTGYDLIPTHVDGDGTVHIAEEDEANAIMERIYAASEALK
ncbi:MAG: CapA family protein [Anaerolineae bacterium]|nr:CapA family protein [Anaerolineae bacterium]